MPCFCHHRTPWIAQEVFLRFYVFCMNRQSLFTLGLHSWKLNSTAQWQRTEHFVRHNDRERNTLYGTMTENGTLFTAQWQRTEHFVRHNDRERNTLYGTMTENGTLCTAQWQRTEHFVAWKLIRVPESLATENPLLPVKTAQSLGSISFTFGHRIFMVESETFLIAVLTL